MDAKHLHRRRYLEVKALKFCTSLWFKSSVNCTQLRLEEYLWQLPHIFSLFLQIFLGTVIAILGSLLQGRCQAEEPSLGRESYGKFLMCTLRPCLKGILELEYKLTPQSS